MKIILTGVETNNKGAELMLYAILQEIERKYPKAKVYIHINQIPQGLDYVKTKVKLKYWPLSYLLTTFHIPGIYRRLHLNYDHIEDVKGVCNADYFIDGSGFAFSDVWDLNDVQVWKWKSLLSYHHKKGCKIIFLPQAFGPIQKENTKIVMEEISKTASVIMPREEISYNYLKSSGVVDMSKVKKFTDFTSLVKGAFPPKYEHLRGGICIIPNVRMVDKGAISLDDYKNIILEIAVKGKASGHIVYLLNHEGSGDEKLAYTLKEMLNNEVEVVTNLDALDVKGLIASAYLVVSSRFHGVASALNSCVPCLATSWSHKYQELFKDYGFTDCVLPIDNLKATLAKVEEYIDEINNNSIREKLKARVPQIEKETRSMWETIWNL